MLNAALLALLSATPAPDFTNELVPDWRGWESTDYAAWRDWSNLDASGFIATPDDPATTALDAQVFSQGGPLIVDSNGDLCYPSPPSFGFGVGYTSPNGKPIHEILVQVSSPTASNINAFLVYFASPPDSDNASPVEVIDLSPTERAFRFRLRARGLGPGAIGDVDSGVIRINANCLDAVIIDVRYELDGEFQPQGCPNPNVNSGFQLAAVDAGGSSIASGNLFRLTASGIPVGQFGYFITSQTFQWTPCSFCSEGELCLGGDIARLLPAQAAGSDYSFERMVDLTAIPLTPTVPVVAGSTWHFQAWYRDNLSSGPVTNFTLPQSVIFQ